ncbi:hypothetical protein [Burkholderia sp. Ax-1719]|uniref:hypothetical protein n=1 Tax=Burkholderia sp. Ax-1719 TaxID=2608334 RepID=UPI0014245AC9|nr:hypothetical protein [Burkholderia sp. Ax-1719]NIE64265.1 hypothetical protein [Burkholderia sp. Ax-1719]
MTLQDELNDFYSRCGFAPSRGPHPRTVPVFTGCLLVPLPNIETRHRYLKYHDLHHMMTGFSVGRIGEGEVSAWELGTGSMLASPLLGIMNLIALSTGWILQPRRMWRAFSLGCRSRNLYSRQTREAIDNARWASLASLRGDFLGDKEGHAPGLLRGVEFGAYVMLAMVIHAIIAVPAVIVRIGSEIATGKPWLEAVKPTKPERIF